MAEETREPVVARPLDAGDEDVGRGVRTIRGGDEGCGNGKDDRRGVTAPDKLRTDRQFKRSKEMMVVVVPFFLAFSAVAGHPGAKPKLYMRAKHDGCGAQAQQAVHLLWVPTLSALRPAGGFVGDAGRSSHGWACDALLGGLGLPRLGADARACVSANMTWRDLRRRTHPSPASSTSGTASR